MSEYKTEISNLDTGSRFYFQNDPDSIVWTVLDSRRKSSNNNAVFVYCEDPAGKVIDYNSNRTVVCLRGDSMPSEYSKKKELSKQFLPPPKNLQLLLI